MKAEIIAVGTELLMGQIVNTNATSISQFLTKWSIPVYHHQVVGDNEERLRDAIGLAQSRSDLIVLCGGIGPTQDDITKQVLAQVLDLTLVEDPDGMAIIEAYHQRSHRPMTPNNRRQALVFPGARILENKKGLALGCAMENDSIHYVVLPGPPHELLPMLEGPLATYLQDCVIKGDYLQSLYLRFFGIGESALTDRLNHIIQRQTNPTIAPYAGPFEVVLRLTASSTSKTQGQEMLEACKEEILKEVGEFCYGQGQDTSLASLVHEGMLQSGKSLAVAESFTGGLFSASLVDQAGASAYFKGASVAYSRQSKEEVLGIAPDLLDQYGMISSQCAQAMALAVKELYGTDLAMAFTGNAGPDAWEGKEVGTLYIALAHDQECQVVELHLARDRNGNRAFAVQHGLNLLRQYLQKL